MKLTISSPVFTKRGKKNTWVAPGTYEIVRWFNPEKVIINVSNTPDVSRLITVVPVRIGILSQ